MDVRAWGLEFSYGVWVSGYGVQALRVKGLGFKV